MQSATMEPAFISSSVNVGVFARCSDVMDTSVSEGSISFSSGSCGCFGV